MKQSIIKPVFLDSAPDILDDGILYISEKYQTAIHKCCCGCGEEVVTPFSPVEWRLQKEGATVSLHPSIGNWDYQCKSHYLIIRNQVVWAGALTKRGIDLARARDKADKLEYVKKTNFRTKGPEWFISKLRRLIYWLGMNRP